MYTSSMTFRLVFGIMFLLNKTMFVVLLLFFLFTNFHAAISCTDIPFYGYHKK